MVHGRALLPDHLLVRDLPARRLHLPDEGVQRLPGLGVRLPEAGVVTGRSGPLEDHQVLPQRDKGQVLCLRHLSGRYRGRRQRCASLQQLPGHVQPGPADHEPAAVAAHGPTAAPHPAAAHNRRGLRHEREANPLVDVHAARDHLHLGDRDGRHGRALTEGDRQPGDPEGLGSLGRRDAELDGHGHLQQLGRAHLHGRQALSPHVRVWHVVHELGVPGHLEPRHRHDGAGSLPHRHEGWSRARARADQCSPDGARGDHCPGLQAGVIRAEDGQAVAAPVRAGPARAGGRADEGAQGEEGL
mmetsp:Transcript_59166/g.152187  ORF Transcript_59166/g.152187 Transcript_59166/m.152187 type:complete len:300 (-) Transcript_59166:1208-2107(-)